MSDHGKRKQTCSFFFDEKRDTFVLFRFLLDEQMICFFAFDLVFHFKQGSFLLRTPKIYNGN